MSEIPILYWKNFFSILLFFSLGACAPEGEFTSFDASALSQKDPGIIRGSSVEASHPIGQNTVGIQTDEGICTGVLIGKNHALTAAHCLNGNKAQVITIHLGTSMNHSQFTFYVDTFVRHHDFSEAHSLEKNSADIALLHFKGTLPTGFKPAPLLPYSVKLTQGQEVVAAGFGRTNAQNSSPQVLNQTTLKIQNLYESVSEILLNQTKGTGICFGDSGGPIFSKINGTYYLWGLSKSVWDPTGGTCNEFSVATNIRYYGKWLDEKMNLLH